MVGTEEIALGYLTTRIGHPEPGTSKLRSTIAAERKRLQPPVTSSASVERGGALGKETAE